MWHVCCTRAPKDCRWFHLRRRIRWERCVDPLVSICVNGNLLLCNPVAVHVLDQVTLAERFEYIGDVIEIGRHTAILVVGPITSVLPSMSVTVHVRVLCACYGACSVHIVCVYGSG